MSWTQGVQDRKTLPDWFVTWADTKLGEPLLCIVWELEEPNVLSLVSETFTARLDLTGTRFAT